MRYVFYRGCNDDLLFSYFYCTGFAPYLFFSCVYVKVSDTSAGVDAASFPLLLLFGMY